MDYIENLINALDPETRARIESGRYRELLEASLPPRTDPNYRRWYNHAVSAVARGRNCLEIVSRYAPVKGARVLDFGCGDGGFSVVFARAGAEVTGIDADPGRIERARALAENFAVAADFRLDREFGQALPAKNFDIIVANDLIEHVDSFSGLARSLARLLADSGCLYLNAPNRFSLRLLPADPHYGLAGLSLLDRRAGSFYVTRLRRRSPTFALNRLLGFYEVKRIFRAAGIELTCQSDEKIQRYLHDPALPGLKKIAALVPDSLLVPLIRLFILDQWIMIGKPLRRD